MIGTIAAVASGVTVYMIVTALMHPRTVPNDSVPSNWAIVREAVREGAAPWWALTVVLASEVPGLLWYWAWRLTHPTIHMALSAATWTALVLLGTGIAQGVRLLSEETGLPFPLILTVLCIAVTVQQFVATSRRVGRRGALRIARFDVISNLVIPLSTWAAAALIGTLA